MQTGLFRGYSEYALEGYKYKVADYLLKRFSFERFFKAVTPVFHDEQEASSTSQLPLQQSPSPDHLFIKGDAKNKYHRVELKEVLYIEGLRNYVQFICENSKIITLQNLKSLEEDLPGDQFIRIHKPFIVNVDQITEVDGNSLLVRGNRLPIGSSYRSRFFGRIKGK